MTTSHLDDEFSVLVRRAGLDVPYELRQGTYDWFVELRRMASLLRERDDADALVERSTT